MKNPFEALLSGQLAGIQQNLTRALEELEGTVLEGSAGGGAVTVSITGSGNVLDVRISPSAVSEKDLELLQDLVCAAVRDAIAKAATLRKEKVMQATPLGGLGMNLPDIF